MSTSNHASFPKPGRRLSLQLAAATTAVGLLVVQEATSPVQAQDLPPGPLTAPLVVPLPVYPPKQTVSAWVPPPGESTASGECGQVPHQRWYDLQPQKFYTLNVRQALHALHPEWPTQTVWGFNGLVSGPPFVERYGVPMVARIDNDLPANTVGFGSPEFTTHRHHQFYLPNGSGLHVNACQIHDKHADSVAAVPPGQRKPAAAPGAGPYTTEAGLRTVASGDMGADPAAIQREIEKSTASLESVKDPESIALLQDYIADLEGLQERLGTSRQPPLATSAAKAPPEQRFTYLANNDNLLPAPLTTSKLALAPAERAGLVPDFFSYPLGATLYLANRLMKVDARGPDGLLAKAGTQLLRFDLDADPPTADLSRVPAILRLLPPINLAEVVRNRLSEFDKGNEVWTVNGKIFDVDNPVAKPKRGTSKSGHSKARATGTSRFLSTLK